MASLIPDEDYSSDERDDTENRDCVQVGSMILDLPPQIFQDPTWLEQVFSQDSWSILPQSERARLTALLPDFGNEDTNQRERATTLSLLFEGQNIKFGNPVEMFKENFRNGKLQPDSVKMRAILKRAQLRHYRAKLRERDYKALRDSLVARKKVLGEKAMHSISSPLSVLKMERKSVRSVADFERRVAKRYFRELNVIRRGAGETGNSSEDEIYPDGPPTKISTRDTERDISLLDSDYWSAIHNGSAHRRISGLSSEVITPMDSEEAALRPSTSQPPTADNSFQQDVLCAIKSPLHSPELLSPSFETLLNRSPISETLAQLKPLPNLSPKKESTDSLLKPLELRKQEPQGQPCQNKPPEDDVKVIEQAVANIPGIELHDSQPVENFNLDFCLEGLTQSPAKIPCCFFSLIRDLFRCNANLTLSIKELRNLIRQWQEEYFIRSELPSEWVKLVESWVDLADSAVDFLATFPDHNADDPRPLISASPSKEALLWVNTALNSDDLLQGLCDSWFARRHEFGRALQPLNDDFNAEICEHKEVDSHDFHSQERERMSNPTCPFTYHCADFYVTVGPIRVQIGSGSSDKKVKAHPLLVDDRPSHVTIIVLVRDALARMPNAVGTRQLICELVKESQYVKEQVVKDDKALTSAVSGALDRLQGETDPCCKYDSSKKIWQYLHAGRSTEDFVKVLNEQQSASKDSKTRKTRCSNSGSSKAALNTTTAPDQQHQPDELVLNAVNSIVPCETMSNEDVAMSAVTIPVVPSDTSLAPVPNSPQVIRIMTSEGLKMFRVESQKDAHSSPVCCASSVLASPTVALSSSSTPTTTTSLLKKNQPSLQLASQQSKEMVSAALPVSGIPATATTFLKASNQSGKMSVLAKPMASSALPVLPMTKIPVQSSQRVIVKNSDGKPVQISAAALQKFLTGRNVVCSDSPVQILQRQAVISPLAPSASVAAAAPEQQSKSAVVKIHTNLSNLNPQQLQTVQMLASGASSPVRLVQTSAAGPRLVIASAPTSSTGQPSAHQTITIDGRQYLIRSNSSSSNATATPVATAVNASASGQVLLQTASGKPIVLSQSIPNIRIIQQPQPSSSNSTKK